MSLIADPSAIALALAGVFLIAFMKGAFGGGAATVGIPLLALAMDPLTAGALLAPLLIAMDIFALRYFTPSTWSWPDVVRVMPGFRKTDTEFMLMLPGDPLCPAIPGWEVPEETRFILQDGARWQPLKV